MLVMVGSEEEGKFNRDWWYSLKIICWRKEKAVYNKLILNNFKAESHWL